MSSPPIRVQATHSATLFFNQHHHLDSLPRRIQYINYYVENGNPPPESMFPIPDGYIPPPPPTVYTLHPNSNEMPENAEYRTIEFLAAENPDWYEIDDFPPGREVLVAHSDDLTSIKYGPDEEENDSAKHEAIKEYIRDQLDAQDRMNTENQMEEEEEKEEKVELYFFYWNCSSEAVKENHELYIEGELRGPFYHRMPFTWELDYAIGYALSKEGGIKQYTELRDAIGDGGGRKRNVCNFHSAFHRQVIKSHFKKEKPKELINSFRLGESVWSADILEIHRGDENLVYPDEHFAYQGGVDDEDPTILNWLWNCCEFTIPTHRTAEIPYYETRLGIPTKGTFNRILRKMTDADVALYRQAKAGFVPPMVYFNDYEPTVEHEQPPIITNSHSSLRAFMDFWNNAPVDTLQMCFLFPAIMFLVDEYLADRVTSRQAFNSRTGLTPYLFNRLRDANVVSAITEFTTAPQTAAELPLARRKTNAQIAQERDVIEQRRLEHVREVQRARIGNRQVVRSGRIIRPRANGAHTQAELQRTINTMSRQTLSDQDVLQQLNIHQARNVRTEMYQRHGVH